MNSSRMHKINDGQEKTSLVLPIIAALLSAIIPGLGQFLGKKFRRGILIFASLTTSLGLLIWRISQESQRYEGLALKIKKAYELNPTFYGITSIIIIIYLLNIADAYQCSNPKSASKKGVGLMILILVVFFMQGWEIGGINPVELFSGADEAVPALTKVLWPWQKALYYPKEIRTIIVKVQAPCGNEPFPPGETKKNEPYLIASPTCGNPSEAGGELGTEFTIMGGNFEVGKEIEFWWKDPINNEFHHRKDGKLYSVVPDENGNINTTLIMPYRVLPPVAGEKPKIWEIQARQLISIGEPQLSHEFTLTVEKMIETIIIGMMATLFGIVLAIPLSFLAARNLMSHSPFTLTIYYIIRTILNIIRSIEPLIWAIIAVIVVGLGPFAGIVALTLHSLAALGKLYSEAIENIDPGPIEAIQATGANWLQTIMYAVVPQIIPPFVSFTIYRWDINIRMSTVIGFVGGGGIGFLLQQWIHLMDYQSAGMAVWFIAITVAILDFVSAEIRERFI